VESVCRLLTEDHRTTLQMIADHLNIGKETVHWIVTEDLEDLREICYSCLDHRAKKERVWCQDLLLIGQDERFWENIITGDETCCFAYDPATK